MSDAVHPEVLGIIDESEPEEPQPADADYSREETDSTSADKPDAEKATEDTPAADASSETKDAVEEPDDVPAEADTQADGEDGATEDKVTFAGREWGSMEEAEQSFKSWEGRIKAAEERSKDYENRLADYYEYVTSTGKENEELRAQLANPEAPAEEPADTTPPEVDMAKILRIAKLAEEKGVDPVEAALKLYHSESSQIMDARLESMKEELSKPYEEMKHREDINTAERELFNWAQSVENDDGTPKYPELQKDSLDEGFVSNVYEAWSTLQDKFGEKYAYSQPAIDYAYRLAHEFAAEQQGTKEPAKAKSEPPSTADRSRMNADAEAASDLTGENPTNINRKKPSSGRQALQELADHREVALNGGESLGFFE